MRDLLRQSNTDLLLDIERLSEILITALPTLLPELNAYYKWVLDACETFRADVQQNLSDIELDARLGSSISSILPDVLISTQVIKRKFEFFNQRLVTPVLRARESDRLCLKVLAWLHSAHSQTRNIPAALSDGEFAIMPDPQLPTIYFLPPSAQHRLLYLTLFFHEYGHLLYACHRREMDDLVNYLQQNIAKLLSPRTQRDDRHDKKEEEKRNIIVETWYEWTQELFCDAVGLMIGGPAFAYALSQYFIMLGPNHYHLQISDLERSSHPVTWLRIRLLIDRARSLGYKSVAAKLERSWTIVSQELCIKEDYYGYFESSFLAIIQKSLDDMIEEAGVAAFDANEIIKLTELPSAGHNFQPIIDGSDASPVLLLNQAWQIFLNFPSEYCNWERKAIALILTN